jgi:hypothetical protein
MTSSLKRAWDVCRGEVNVPNALDSQFLVVSLKFEINVHPPPSISISQYASKGDDLPFAVIL